MIDILALKGAHYKYTEQTIDQENVEFLYLHVRAIVGLFNASVRAANKPPWS